jgi:hypothetical protein
MERRESYRLTILYGEMKSRESTVYREVERRESNRLTILYREMGSRQSTGRWSAESLTD